jgi:hypothetical protein
VNEMLKSLMVLTYVLGLLLVRPNLDSGLYCGGRASGRQN